MKGYSIHSIGRFGIMGRWERYTILVRFQSGITGELPSNSSEHLRARMAGSAGRVEALWQERLVLPWWWCIGGRLFLAAHVGHVQLVDTSSCCRPSTTYAAASAWSVWRACVVYPCAWSAFAAYSRSCLISGTMDARGYQWLLFWARFLPGICS